MKRFLQTDWPFVILLIPLTLFYLWGVRFIPFHPDESTQLYMSSDFEMLFSRPSSLFWDPNREDDPRQFYRELDAPLTKYILGLGRVIAGQPALPVDWDWSQSWEANTQAGALPDANLLCTGRVTITLLLPLSLMFIYLVGKRIHSPAAGLVAALLVGSHALTLLHARRAMAEGPLLFGTTLALWSLLQARKRPWLTGLGIALAFNAKQSALALLPVGLLAVCWLPVNTDQRVRKMAVNLAQFMGVFVVVTVALNPLLWNDPWGAAQASIQARQELISRQIEDIKRIAPEKYLETPTQRVIVLIANLYIGPATYGLVGNLAPISGDVDAYIAIPGHNLLRGLWGGGILLVLTLFGLYLAGRDSWQVGRNRRRELILLLLATTLQGAALIIAVPLPWPRYSIPMIGFECLWIAYGVTRVLERKSPTA